MSKQRTISLRRASELDWLTDESEAVTMPEVVAGSLQRIADGVAECDDQGTSPLVRIAAALERIADSLEGRGKHTQEAPVSPEKANAGAGR